MSTQLIKQNTTTVEAASPRTLKSKKQQWQELLQLRARCRLTPREYYLYGFDEQGKDYRCMLNFMTQSTQCNKFQSALNNADWKVVLDNKWLFYLHCKQFDIRLPEVYGVYEQGAGFTCMGKPLAKPEDLYTFLNEIKPATLVVKPLGGIMGRKLLILDELQYNSPTLQVVTNTGQRLTFFEMADILNAAPNVRFYMNGGYKLQLAGYLLQVKIEQHQFLSQLAPYTTNTIRVVTFLDHANNVDIHFTILRLGRRGNAADNWDQGGISVAVDPVTGMLGQGVLKPKYGGQWLETHPDSGVQFTGKTIPYWDEVIAMCSQAAQVTPKVRSVGWDVALTPSGPVIIEGNPDWDLAMVQVHTQGYLQPAVREKLAHFGLTFPEATLPPVNLHDWRVHITERYRRNRFMKQRR
jgi:hypothetical protein